MEYVLPGNIEKRSFEIIREELRERGICLPADQDPVTRRVIHTTADFDYAETMTYSPDALDTAYRVLRSGGDIVTDTNMTRSGINKKFLRTLGGEVHCFMAEPDVAAEAKERGVTRAAVSMERASKLTKPLIVAVGNAPTALVSLHEIMENTGWRPELIIGVPVGFVNVVPAKELILRSGVPASSIGAGRGAAMWRRPSAMLCCIRFGTEKCRKGNRPWIQRRSFERGLPPGAAEPRRQKRRCTCFSPAA